MQEIEYCFKVKELEKEQMNQPMDASFLGFLFIFVVCKSSAQ